MRLIRECSDEPGHPLGNTGVSQRSPLALGGPPRTPSSAKATESGRTWDQRIRSGVPARRPETPGEKQQVRMLSEPLPSRSEKARHTQVS